ncbi:IlvD/Edd family dehydratase [Chelativorans sp. Marseille-P2723]|uniref:IlvD/Edd family dehydratase n=1 Tax=Chelativorans sp. Marseille-P2723 TaxID=2709133 RepID=UPI0015711476|nr:IlvD/Edd family dehydratase [Chelativorans sp. Marseille-P2723]
MRKRRLRSAEWFEGPGKNAFMYRSWMKNQGLPDDAFDGRPVIGICNTWSELTPCNAHLREVAEKVRRGVLEAGGLPLEFPVTSLGESILRPTAMLMRNLASMDVEESIRGNPIDGVVLLVGCDKTTPALLMGAASCDLPALVVSGGPMLSGRHNGEIIGSGTDVWRYHQEVKNGTRSIEDFLSAEQAMNRSAGSCNTMGTASTMACMVEALGIALPGNAAIPAVDARRYTHAQLAGRRIVEMVKEDLTPSQILTKTAFENAIKVNAAIGGSTNAVIHLIAIAGRLGLKLTLDDWDRVGRGVPTIVNLMPSGQYLMEDFFYAGGLPAVIARLLEKELFDGSALCATGRTMGREFTGAPCYNDGVIRTFDNALLNEGAIAVLKGSLAPAGAIIKPSAATPALMTHTGPAVVFENIDDYHSRIDDPDLEVDADSILVLRNCGPRGFPGMAEVGNMALPAKLLKRGITDMVRISDARMSGTAFGTVVLHCAPEAAIGGPLQAVRTGDRITLNVPERKLELHVNQAQIDQRLAELRSLPPSVGGYQGLYVDHVLQADLGCDFDFLVGKRGAAVARHSH